MFVSLYLRWARVVVVTGFHKKQATVVISLVKSGKRGSPHMLSMNIPINGCETNTYLFLTFKYFQALQNIEKEAILKSVLPHLNECSKDHSITDTNIHTVVDTGDLSVINSCFIACVFKRIGVVSVHFIILCINFVSRIRYNRRHYLND